MPGDVLEVAQGDRVAADLRLLDAAALRAEEAALTGESEPVDKSVDAVADDAPLAERSSLLYAGTVVAAGSGRGVAVATGAGTELGRISALLGAGRAARRRRSRATSTASGATSPARSPRWRCSSPARGRARVRGRATPPWPASAWPWPRCPRDSRRRDDRARRRRAADGRAAGDRPPAAGGRDARRDDRGRLRQDRHAHPQPDAGRGASGRRPATRRSCAWPACCATTRSPGLGDPTETALLDAARAGCRGDPRGAPAARRAAVRRGDAS